jgi:hypothetical protein
VNPQNAADACIGLNVNVTRQGNAIGDDHMIF